MSSYSSKGSDPVAAMVATIRRQAAPSCTAARRCCGVCCTHTVAQNVRGRVCGFGVACCDRQAVLGLEHERAHEVCIR